MFSSERTPSAFFRSGRSEQIRRFAALILTIVLAFSLFACGKGDGEAPGTDGTTTLELDLKIALINNVIEGEELLRDGDIANAVRVFCEKRGFAFAEYKNENSGDAAIVEVIDHAISEGADVVVGAGYFVKDAILYAQSMYSNTEFLILSVDLPVEGPEDVLPNTHFVTFSKEDAAFVAGYIAERLERRVSLAALADTLVTPVYFGGFAAGVSCAANDFGYSDAEAVFCCRSYVTDDGFVRSAERLIDEGITTVAAIGPEVFSAEKASGGTARVISVCKDVDDKYGVLLPSPMYDYGTAAVAALDRLASCGGKWSAKDAGSISTVGVAEGAIKLAFADESFTYDDFEALAARFRSSELKAPYAESMDEITADNVTIDFLD